jgi:hypothetical protein
MSHYSTYQKFFSPEQAEPVLTILKEHGIPFEFIKSKKLVDSVIGGDTSFDNLYELRINGKRFEEVNQLLRDTQEIDINELDSDYYLFSFTDDELVDILRKPDEWSPQDYTIALQVLEERDIVFTTEELAVYRNERLRVLARPEKLHRRLLYIGYVFAFFGGVIGVIIGLCLWQTKKTLPNGKKQFMFDFQTRGHGKLMILFSVIMLVVNFVLNINNPGIGWANLFGWFLLVRF